MLVAVDGTGPWSNKEYAETMKDSFVRRIWQQCPESKRLYYRGPSLLGVESGPTAWAAYSEIKGAYEADKANFKLYLTGYSRGGAIVIAIARLIQKLGIEVECMALFDAVDRSPLVEVDRIADNVKMTYHALRDPKNESRWYFGNCGLTAKYPKKLVKKVFNSTHAGLGGMPWTGDHPSKKIPNPSFNASKWINENRFLWARTGTLPPESQLEIPLITEQEDRRNSQEVKSWMWNNMIQHGMI
jgi:hypothetical protein